MTAAATTSHTPRSELREIGTPDVAEFWHKGETTGGAWVRVPPGALLDVALYVETVS